jgi:hypothetical protein
VANFRIIEVSSLFISIPRRYYRYRLSGIA